MKSETCRKIIVVKSDTVRLSLPKRKHFKFSVVSTCFSQSTPKKMFLGKSVTQS